MAKYLRDSARASDSVRTRVEACRGLTGEFQRQLKGLAEKAEYAGRRRHLSLHPLAEASIDKIGAGRKQALAAHGIFTAADVTEDRVRGVRGFGEMLTDSVLDWRRKVERSYRFDPATVSSSGEARALARDFRDRQRQSFVELNGILDEMKSLTVACQEAAQRLAPLLREAVADYDQARADFRLLTATPKTG